MNTVLNFKIKRLLMVALLLAVFGGLVHYVYAGAAQSARGFAWGGNDGNGLGWISFNDTDLKATCDADNNNFTDVACGGDNVSTPWRTYGVNVPSGNGVLSGYAWSEHYGWISFNDGSVGGSDDLNGCPSGSCSAERSGNNIIGWARILSIPAAGVNGGGFSGWISLSGTSQSGDSYGAKVSGASLDELSGYAYSEDFGWISFNSTNPGSGGGAAYKVTVAIPGGNITAANGCQLPDNVPNPTCNGTFSWTITGATNPNLYNQTTVGTPNGSDNPCQVGATGNLQICLLQRGNNEIHIRDGSSNLTVGATVNAACSPTSTWDAATSMCVPTPDAPTITITANQAFVRSGQVAKINVGIVTNSYPLKCDVYGVDGVQRISHPKTPGTYSDSYGPFDTKALNNAQIVQVKCTHALGLEYSDETRVEVTGTIQEI